MAFDDGDADAASCEERPQQESNENNESKLDRVMSLKRVRNDDKSARTIKSSSGKSSRSKLRVRSNSSVFKTLNKTESRALDDPQESFDYLYKFIIIGDESVGKSNLLLRICKGIFQKKPKTTYGVEFEWKTFSLPNSN